MYKKLPAAALCTALLLLTAQSKAQIALPYFSGFDNDAQKNGWQQFRKGVASSYQWNYTATAAFSAPNCLAHNYPVGGTDTTNDWFVSPPFNLSTGGKLDSLRYAFSGFGVPGAGDTIAVYLLKGSPDPAVAAARTLLYDFRGEHYSSDNVWRNLTSISLPPTSSVCYIAVQYRTVANWLDTRFDNVRISGNTPISIPSTGKQAPFASLYPNPVGDKLMIKTDAAFTQMAFYDIRGRQIATIPFRKETDLSSFAPGTYIVVCRAEAGAVWQRTFLKK
ncbi:T9SS-dependent choice-of-anchor J family protein [Taibaiella koreensis]|uniref:T9SS-dependent choice-of-anchor J family protein n=1 Tax=Taibaiella koreensis TaxID=1268548 RepID=UPI000E59E550|nr:choice-of-anchor J domain-containing protein [Taibaiella koreensis]